MKNGYFSSVWMKMAQYMLQMFRDVTGVFHACHSMIYDTRHRCIPFIKRLKVENTWNGSVFQATPGIM